MDAHIEGAIEGMAQTSQALSIGAKAGTLLRTENARWETLASVAGAIYIVNRDGEMLWITDCPHALHPRAVLLPEIPSDAPAAGSVLRDVGGLLYCDAFRLAWHGAAPWAPGSLSSSERVAVGFPERVTKAIRLAVTSERGPIGNCRGLERAGSDRRPSAREDAAGAIRKAMARDTRLLSGIATGKGVLPALRAAAGLVGLGEGLTPEGDDILGGYLFTLRSLSSIRRLTLNIDWEAVTAWLHSVAQRTNAISHCMLVDHARGDACAPLVEFVRGALEGTSDERLAQLVVDVAGIGASSGRSLLVGVCAASHVAKACGESSRLQSPTQARAVVGRSWGREVVRVR